MKSLSSIIGWLLLIAVLAVPSFLFYNWWTKNKQQASAEMPQEPVQHNIFPADKGQSAPAFQPAAAVSTAAPAAQPPAQPQQAHRPAQPASAPQAAAPVQPADAQPSASSQPPAVSSAAAASPVAVSTQAKAASYYSPKSQRDPMLSPDDYRRIKEAEEARLEEERARRYADTHKPKEPSVTDRIALQGIVGNAAIINGDMFYVGQSYKGVKLTKIGSNYVILEYKGKLYKKVMK